MSETGCQRFFVMRHGASESNLAGVVQGVMDVPLALLGKEQAAEAGKALVGKGITRVLASPLQRALETALIVAQELQLGVSIVDGLRARNLGEWAGKPRSEIKEMWADLEHPFRKDPHFAPPGGESLHAVDQRMFAAIEQALEQESDGVPLFVMHLIGTGALIQREVGGERPAFGNADVWEVNRETKRAIAVFESAGDKLPGDE